MAKTKSTPKSPETKPTRRRRSAKLEAAIEIEAPKVEAPAPKAPKTPKVKEPKPPRPTQQAYDRRKDGTLSARGLTCLCGCGQPTTTRDARFLSGHDAKLRKALLVDKLPCPEIVRPFFENGEVIAGVMLEGGEFVDVKAGRAGGIVTDEVEE